MVEWIFSSILLLIAFFAGFLGSLTGLGGGVIVIPALVLIFKVDIHYAMGASLMSVIATSSGSAMAYLKEGYTNLKIGIFLEMGAVVGAIIGASLVSLLPTPILGVILGVFLIFSSLFSARHKENGATESKKNRFSDSLGLDGSYLYKGKKRVYQVQRPSLGFFLLTFAGFFSGLLGIGSGALKVLAMDKAMQLPFKVSTTTSNFIIGITAAASTGIYLSHGYINPVITFPVILGVVLGSFSGTKILAKLKTKTLRYIFAGAIFLIGIEMIYKGIEAQI